MREPHLYGNVTLDNINKDLKSLATKADILLETFQSNSEAEIVTKIQSLINQSSSTQAVDFIIINPAAFTHTSIAIRDALSAVKIAFIEVHLSNVFARESFRHHSYFSDIAVGVISGMGAQGYYAALNYAANQFNNITLQN